MIDMGILPFIRLTLLFPFLYFSFVRAETKTLGNHFRKFDNAVEDAKTQEDGIQILDHLQCSQENACRYIAKSKEGSNGFRRFYTQPDAKFQEIWQKETFKG